MADRKIYRLLTGADDAAFCVRVGDALKDGYVLYGSPGITQGPEGPVVCQAVVLPEYLPEFLPPRLKETDT
ncbi:MAG: DUF1737 domain-containing protein [Thalassobaculaceae bacterium]